MRKYYYVVTMSAPTAEHGIAQTFPTREADELFAAEYGGVVKRHRTADVQNRLSFVRDCTPHTIVPTCEERAYRQACKWAGIGGEYEVE